MSPAAVFIPTALGTTLHFPQYHQHPSSRAVNTSSPDQPTERRSAPAPVTARLCSRPVGGGAAGTWQLKNGEATPKRGRHVRLGLLMTTWSFETPEHDHVTVIIMDTERQGSNRPLVLSYRHILMYFSKGIENIFFKQYHQMKTQLPTFFVCLFIFACNFKC